MIRPFAHNFCTRGIVVLFVVTITLLDAPRSLTQVRKPAQRRGSAASPQDSRVPVFLPAVLYDSGGTDVLQTNGGQFQGIAVADINGDGKLDAVVSNFAGPQNTGNGVVGVFLGNGEGTFQSVLTFGSGGYGAVSVVLADVNADGKPDVVVANNCISASDCTTGTVAVLLGNGNGTFQTAVTYGSGGHVAASMVVADVNGDGKFDILVANQYQEPNGDGLLGVLLGNGDGTFQPAISTSSGGVNASALAVADLNGDGRPDAVITIAGQFPVSANVLLGNGDGTFQNPIVWPTDAYIPSAIAIADLNGDGKLDLVVANWNSGSLSVGLGNGDGTFQAAAIYSSGGAAPDSVVAVDVNGDGALDLVTGNCGSSEPFFECGQSNGVLSILAGNGDGTFQPPVTFTSGARNEVSVAFADLNGDGKPDLLVGNQNGGNNGNGSLGVLLNSPGVDPTTTTFTSSPNPSPFGQAVTFTAVVGSTFGTPTGTVIFRDGSATLGTAALGNGSASISVSSLPAGSHSLTAAYQGSNIFEASSAPLDQLVNQATTTTLLLSSRNPTPPKRFVTYSATVTGQASGPVSGTVTFKDGGATIATVGLSGDHASYSASYPVKGIHSITAIYSGDTNNVGNVSLPLLQTIGKGFSSLLTLTTSGSPSLLGQPVTFTATLSSSGGAIPDGELVTFHNGRFPIGSSVTSGGAASLTTTWLQTGSNSIKAAYNGDGTFEASAARIKQVVDNDPTTTTIVSSVNPSTHGQAVTFTATVTSSAPNQPLGKVAFRDGTRKIGSAMLNSGTASLTTSTLTVGSHSITAEYLGYRAYDPSTSPVLNQVVNP